MEVKVIRSKRRSVSIKINEKGEVFFRCPLKFSKNQIVKILQDKQQWIQKCVNYIKQKRMLNQDFYDYKKILFNGKIFNIETNSRFIKIGDNLIKLKCNNIKKTLVEWLKKQAQILLFDRLDLISNKIGKNYNQARIMTARKKWGSCDNNKNIRLNYRLVMLANEYIDYVCLHELTHTQYMNHSKYFWNEVAKFLPNWKQVKVNMSNFNFILEIY